MRKIGRNEPCPCGSGKKYKKCCGNTTAPIADVQTINQSLLQLHQNLISSISTTYQRQIEELTDSYSYSNSNTMDESTMEVYKTGLIPWVISHVPNAMDNETIIRDFMKNNVIPLHTKVYFDKWAEAAPSVYEVVEINKPIEHYAMIKEIDTEELFHIPYHRSNELIKGSLLIGTLVPFADYHNFLYTMITLYNRDTKTYIQLINQYRNRKGLKENFPAFFSEALTTGTDTVEWADPIYEEVAEVFVNHMIEKDMDDRTISHGVQLWQQYCAKEQPTIKKAEAYVAALDYFVQKEILDDTEQTQGHLAEEYNTSPGTISKIYRNLVTYRTLVK